MVAAVVEPAGPDLTAMTKATRCGTRSRLRARTTPVPWVAAGARLSVAESEAYAVRQP